MVFALAAAGALLVGCASDDGASTSTTAVGVSDDSVTVGFLAVDVGQLSQNLGFVTVEDGGYTNVAKGIQSVVDWANTNGGLGGRTLKPVIKPYTATQDSPEYAESVCKSFTQDDRVFAVVFNNQFQNNARPCYRSGQAVMIDQTFIAHDAAEYAQYAPYLWSTALPEFGAFIRTKLRLLRDAGWFSGSSGVAVVFPDTEVTRRAADTVVLPELSSFGVTSTRTFAVDSSNAGTLGATSAAALAGAQSAGLDRVLVIGGARILPVMLAQAEAESLEARYSIATYDNPAFFVDNPDTVVTERRNGMAGLGVQGGGDMRLGSGDVPFPDPGNPSEQLCKQIVDGAGAAPPASNRENYNVVFQFCDAVLLLKAAFDAVPRDAVSVEAFRDAVFGLGPAWRSALSYGANGWPSGAYAGATTGRGIVWDPGCALPERTPGCFRYGTSELPLVASPS
jgi:hypothetical protein